MSKLVDKERLAKLAKALNDRMKAAVKAEETRALQAESRIEGKADQNAAAIAAINNEENGLLAQAKGYTNSAAAELDKKIQTKVSTSEYEAKVTELENKDKDMAADILGLDTAVKAIENKIGDGDLNLPAIDKAIKDFKEEQQGIDAAQNQKVAALEEALNGNGEDVPGLKAEVADIEERLDAEGGLVDRLEAVEEFKQGHSHEGLQSEIDALEGRADVLEQFKTAHSHTKIEADIAALQELHKEGGVVDEKVSEVREAVESLQSEFDTFEQAQIAKEAEQDAAIAKKVEQDAYNEKVAELAKADTDLDAAIKAEAARADGVEKGLQQAIDDINDAEDGILAQAKELVNAEKDLRVEADTALDERLQVVENSVGQGGTLEARVKANEDKLAGLEEGCTTVQAAIDKAEADAKAHAEAKIAELVDSAPEAMDTLNELAKAINDNKDVYDSYVEQHAQAMAKQKEDLQKEIDADIATAVGVKAAEGVEATGLRKEIADAVKEEADRAKLEEAAIRSDFAAADATLKSELQAEIDADVKVEKDRAEAAEKALADRLDVLEGEGEGSVAKAIEDAVKVEETRALAQEAAIRSEFAAADQGLSGRIADLEEIMGVGGEEVGKSALEEIREDIAALEQEDEDLAAEDVRLQGEIDKKVAIADYNTKVQALEGADSALDNRIKVFEAGGAQDVAAKEVRLAAAEQDIDALQQFMNGHNHQAMQDQIELNRQGVASNKAAIEVLNGDVTKEGSVAKSIADALAPYATEAETLAVIGQVVNSLALTMESNKMVLKLGGTNGVAINEVSLDMVTDADIEEIIEGLDDVNPTAFNF